MRLREFFIFESTMTRLINIDHVDDMDELEREAGQTGVTVRFFDWDDQSEEQYLNKHYPGKWQEGDVELAGPDTAVERLYAKHFDDSPPKPYMPPFDKRSMEDPAGGFDHDSPEWER